MEPKLVAIAGPLKGSSFPIVGGELVIGRDPQNNIAVNDPLVSRRHCSIRNRGAEIQVADLESLNGTFVNGIPTREKTLEHGDRIKVGDSQFVFLLHEDAGESTVPLSDAFDGQL